VVQDFYKALFYDALYTLNAMSTTGDLRVSQRGQMSLPASARHRWGLDEDGELGYLDVGEVLILVPGGVERLRQQLLDGVSTEDWERARSGFGDRDLANE
jgi:bifunctional DNA-binding transcriptional regulator/antitoxin component of YhaV-PrlF toxin-antitoxin module